MSAAREFICVLLRVISQSTEIKTVLSHLLKTDYD